jgi:ATP-dependent DNA helicase RecG
MGSAPALKQKLEKLGLGSDNDLILHLPLRYEDHTRLCPISALVPGQAWQVEGEVTAANIQYRPRRTLVCQIQESRGVLDGSLTLRFFHFYPNHVKALAVGKRIRAFGEVRMGYHGLEMVHPSFHAVTDDEPLPDRLTPVYPNTAGLPQEALRRLILRSLHDSPRLLIDPLPEKLRSDFALWEFGASVRTLHEPPPEASAQALDERSHPAWRRLKFDELLAQQLSLRRMRRERQAHRAPALKGADKLGKALIAKLPFALTRAQQRVEREIARDLARPVPMHRLLQGDVGSGKTIVAALAALRAVENGFQAAFMAPTEILAEQHFRKLEGWLANTGVRLVWLTGGMSARQRQAAQDACASGEPLIAIGTHALFQRGVSLPKLALAIIDEQHRFGVAQRLALRGKGGDGETESHQLMMSATPIPRTLAMSYYTDLDVSVLDELPPGRTPVVTKLVSQHRREEVIARVRKACAEGRQVYWVCPLIEESEKLQLQTAISTHEALATVLPDLRVGLLHGRLKPAEKAEVMGDLVAGKIDVLVATTVIEVGVDVPNATLMVIEHAERFGLAQLHQLRGRVGRGAEQSVCVLLFGDPLSDTAKARLKVIYESSDGFEIAREDLRIRGPGEVIGSRQSGVPLLRFADLERDVDVLEEARDAAEQLLADHPDVVEAHLLRWLGSKEAFIRA